MGARHVGESVDNSRLEGLLGVVGSAVDYPLTTNCRSADSPFDLV